jgi:hypothetical protein
MSGSRPGSYVRGVEGLVPRWVRIGLVALASGPLVTGLWAVLATRSWFDRFPGVGADVVAAEPPFNAHLASDAGAGFLATGVALITAALWAQRSAVSVALLAYLSFALPHVVYHLAHPADALSGAERAINLALLGSGVAIAAVLGWGARTRPTTSIDQPPDTRSARDAATVGSRS